MTNQEIIVKKLPLTKSEDGKPRDIEVSVRYDRGDFGSVRGYWLHVQPYTRDGRFSKCNPRDGYKMLIQTASRFGAKKLQTTADNLPQDTVDSLVEAVTRKGYELA